MAAPLPEALPAGLGPDGRPGLAAPARPRHGRAVTLEIAIPAALLILIVGGCFLGPLLFPVGDAS